MLIGVLGADEWERPLLLRLSEHSQRVTISQNTRIAYLLPVEYSSLNPKTLSGHGYLFEFNRRYSLYVSFFMLLLCQSKHVQSTSI